MFEVVFEIQFFIFNARIKQAMYEADFWFAALFWAPKKLFKI